MPTIPPGTPVIVVEVPEVGWVWQTLPLPGGVTTDEWLKALCQAMPEASRWTLANAPGRSGSPTPTQPWSPVPTAVSPSPPTGEPTDPPPDTPV